MSNLPYLFQEPCNGEHTTLSTLTEFDSWFVSLLGKSLLGLNVTSICNRDRKVPCQNYVSLIVKVHKFELKYNKYPKLFKSYTAEARNTNLGVVCCLLPFDRNGFLGRTLLFL